MAGGMTEVARATVTIIPNMQGSQGVIAKELTSTLGGGGGAAATAGADIGKSFAGGIGGAVKKFLPALGVAAIGGELLNLGKEFEEVEQIIVTGTGASGEALEGLKDSAKAIASDVPMSFTDAADAVQDLNTRMGLTGENLEEVGKRVGALSELTGAAVDMDKLTGSFNAFGVSNDEAAGKMDYLFNVSQATGIQFNDLTGVLEKNAPALQALGFSFEESANMAGLLDKAGMDAQGTMSKMSKAMVTLAKDGEEPADAFKRVIDEMQGMIDQGDIVGATDLASKVFGTKGATQFIGAVQSGALNLEDLKDTALGAGDGIEETMNQTMTFDQKLEVIGNKFKSTFEPLGSLLLDVIGGALDGIAEGLDWLSESLDLTFQAFSETGEWLGGAFDEAVETIKGIPDQIKGFFDTAANNIKTTFANVVANITSIPGKIVGFFAGIPNSLSTFFNTAKTRIAGIFTGIVSSIKSVPSRIIGFFTSIPSKIASIFNNVKSNITRPIETAKQTLSNIINRIKSIFNVKLKIPLPKVPKISVDGGQAPWGFGGVGKPPKISVAWAATGGITDGISLLGVGEAGREAIVPLSNPYMAPFARAVAEEMPNGGRGDMYFNLNYTNDARANDLARDTARLLKLHLNAQGA